MTRKNKVILWDRHHRVEGFVIEAGRDGVWRRVASAVGQASGSFIEQFAEVNAKLRHHKADAIVVGGAIADAYWFELTLPPTPLHELKNALEFEIPRQLPRPVEEVVWFFRLLETGKQHCRVRVFVGEKMRWQELVNALREGGVLCDAYCHALTAVEVKHDGETLFLPEQQPEYLWRRAEGEPVD